MALGLPCLFVVCIKVLSRLVDCFTVHGWFSAFLLALFVIIARILLVLFVR